MHSLILFNILVNNTILKIGGDKKIMDTILEEISRELEKLDHDKHVLFVSKKNRTQKYKHIRLMENNLRQAYDSLKKYKGMVRFLN